MCVRCEQRFHTLSVVGELLFLSLLYTHTKPMNCVYLCSANFRSNIPWNIVNIIVDMEHRRIYEVLFLSSDGHIEFSIFLHIASTQFSSLSTRFIFSWLSITRKSYGTFIKIAQPKTFIIFHKYWFFTVFFCCFIALLWDHMADGRRQGGVEGKLLFILWISYCK